MSFATFQKLVTLAEKHELYVNNQTSGVAVTLQPPKRCSKHGGSQPNAASDHLPPPGHGSPPLLHEVPKYVHEKHYVPVPEPSPPTYHKVPVPVPVKEPGKARMVWGGEVGGVGWGKVKFLLGKDLR